MYISAKYQYEYGVHYIISSEKKLNLVLKFCFQMILKNKKWKFTKMLLKQKVWKTVILKIVNSVWQVWPDYCMWGSGGLQMSGSNWCGLTFQTRSSTTAGIPPKVKVLKSAHGPMWKSRYGLSPSIISSPPWAEWINCTLKKNGEK